MNLWVRVGQDEHAVAVSPTATVADLKREVHKRLSIKSDPDAFGIAFEDELLADDSEWVGNIGFEDGDRVRVTLRPEHKAMLMLSQRGIAADDAALEVAIAEGDTDVMRMILTSGQVKGGHHLTAAVRARDQELIAKLIEVGVDLNARDRDGFTPLVEAASGGSADLVHQLLSRGAEADYPAETGCTALMTAALFPSLHAVRALLECGAHPNVRAADGCTALLHATLGGQLEILQSLLAAGADPNIADFSGFTALMDASMSGRADIVDALLASGADPNLQASDKCDGITALLAAARCGRLEIARTLLAKQANPNAFDSHRFSPLSYAAKRADVGMVEALLQAGADPDGTPPPRDASQAVRTPMLWAVRMSDCVTLVRLLQAGADPNFAPLGFSPLHAAMFARESCPAMVAALLAKGADPTAVDASGTTAADYAQRRTHPDREEVLELLRGRQAEDMRDDDGCGACCSVQ